MKLIELVWYFFDFSMFFCEFYKIYIFIEKEKMKEKEKKACTSLVQPIMKPVQLEGFNRSRKISPPEEAHLVLDILHQKR